MQTIDNCFLTSSFSPQVRKSLRPEPRPNPRDEPEVEEEPGGPICDVQQDAAIRPAIEILTRDEFENGRRDEDDDDGAGGEHVKAVHVCVYAQYGGDLKYQALQAFGAIPDCWRLDIFMMVIFFLGRSVHGDFGVDGQGELREV